jgi:cytoskeletal protein CcmA (bactofilin family)
MAKQEEINQGISHNTIAAGTVIKGEIRSEGDVRIDGSVDGTILCKGKIIIGTKGEFKGTLTAANIDVMGYIQGEVLSENLLTIKSTGKIEGEVTTKTIIIEQEAILNGSCKMISGNENKPKTEIITPNLLNKEGKTK